MRTGTALLVTLVAVSGLATAEVESRKELIEAERDRKVAELSPETPPTWESRTTAIERSLPYRLVTGTVEGFGVSFGAIVPGTAFAVGPQYRTKGLWHGRIDLCVQARAAANQSYIGRFDAAVPRFWGDHAFLEFTAVHRNISEMPYYGPGPFSEKSGRSDYRLEDTNVELRPGIRFGDHLKASLIGSYLAVNTGPGHSTQFISTERQFGPDTAPGIARQTDFWRGGARLEYDSRNSAGVPTSGGRYWAQYTRYLDNNLSRYSFMRLDLDASQYIPLLNGTRVIALHGASSLTTTNSTQQVPFYLQPALGGPENLRGYRLNRFTGDNSTFLTAEYRWDASPLLQMVAFSDAGKVFNRWEQWNLHDIESDVGFGLRFKNLSRVVFSIDTGFSHEGFQIWFRANSL